MKQYFDNGISGYKIFRLLILVQCLFLNTSFGRSVEQFILVKGMKPNATIIIARNPGPAANLGALELQHHIQLISGATIPIVHDIKDARGYKIHIGDTPMAGKFGFKPDLYAPQEYSIAFIEDNIFLYGKDWHPTQANLSEKGRTIDQVTLNDTRISIDYNRATYQSESETKNVLLPGIYDDQGSLYATYDFVETALGVRWYGPADFNVVYPKQADIVVVKENRRRSPKMKYRDGTGLGGPMISEQFGNPRQDAIELFFRRLRRGGEKWGVNHSLSSFQDRFLSKNPEAPDLFERKREEFFAKGREGGAHSRQFCYTNQALIDQLVQDARDFFDGKGVKGRQIALGDYFAVLPLDNGTWCLEDECQAMLSGDKTKRNGDHFSSGTATNYIFTFVNEVAKEIKKSHPDKKIGTLAYHVYSYYPDKVELEDNLSVSPCLHSRHYMSPWLKNHEISWYKDWVNNSKAPVYLWNYNTFPTERGIFGYGAYGEQKPWNVFPGFSAHQQAELIKMYHEDNIRGVFLCGVGEQLDYYLAMKHYDDPDLQIEVTMQEFFTSYFGAGGPFMKMFYRTIEEVYNDFSRYPDRVKGEKHFQEDEEIAWDYLGTDEVMDQLEQCITQAKLSNLTAIERKRVESWEKGVWEYMKKGKADYLKKKV